MSLQRMKKDRKDFYILIAIFSPSFTACGQLMGPGMGRGRILPHRSRHERVRHRELRPRHLGEDSLSRMPVFSPEKKHAVHLR